MYTITNKNTGETKEVKLHTAGEGFALFADASLEGEDFITAETIRFENPDKDDATLSNDEWTIAPTPVEEVEETPTTVEEIAE